MSRPYVKSLSDQQEEIMSLAIKGKYNHEIAESLNIHEDVVETQIRRVNKKLGTRNKFGSALIVLANDVAEKVATETAKAISTQIAANIRSCQTWL